MVKCLWECGSEGCNSKAIVPENVVPKGWYRFEVVYGALDTPNLEKYELIEEEQFENDNTSEGEYSCTVFDRIEACCIEHVIQLATQTIQEMMPSEVDSE